MPVDDRGGPGTITCGTRRRACCPRCYTHVSSHIRARQSSIGIGSPVNRGQK